MNNILGLAIFGLGIVLLILGFSESQSLGSEISRVFTGNPTEKSVWLIAGGALAVIAGLYLALRGAQRG